jgi:hypothetical protein
MIGIVLLAGAHVSLRRSGRTLPVRAQGDPTTAPLVEGHLLRHRWLYLQNNFQVTANVARVIGILDRAAAAGFNGVVFPDVKLGRLEDGSLPERYYSQLATVLEHADGLGLAVLPAAADVGYSESLLWHDPNLAATLPVRGAPFVARGDRLLAVDDPPLRLANGDFEPLPGSGDAFPGWAWQDEPGRTTFIDREVRHGGRASLRMESPGLTNPPHGNARIQQRLQVGAFRHNAAERDEPYYLVNGDWSGSWAGLEPEIGVVNWNRGAARRDSAAFFAERGHRQILAGYYDAAPGRFTDRAWLADLSGLSGIDGVMYTQWGSGFDGIEAWAEHVWGDAGWAPVAPTPGVGTPAPGVTPTSAARPTPAATAPASLGRALLPQLLR